MKEKSVAPICHICGKSMIISARIRVGNVDVYSCNCRKMLKNRIEIAEGELTYCQNCFSPLIMGVMLYQSICSNYDCINYSVVRQSETNFIILYKGMSAFDFNWLAHSKMILVSFGNPYACSKKLVLKIIQKHCSITIPKETKWEYYMRPASR